MYFSLVSLFSSLPPTVWACLCQLPASLTITLSDPVLEGMTFTITCTTSGAGADRVALIVNGLDSGINGVIQSDTTMRVFDYGTLDTSNSVTLCFSALTRLIQTFLGWLSTPGTGYRTKSWYYIPKHKQYCCIKSLAHNLRQH